MTSSSLWSLLQADDVLGLAAERNAVAAARADRDINGRSLLHAATASGATDCALWLIDNRLADVEAQDVSGETALMRAAFTGNVPVLETLLKHGANVMAVSLVGGTALHHAYAGGQQAAPVVEPLLAAGSDPLHQDHSGRTPQDWSVQGQAMDAGAALLTREPAATPPRTLRLKR